MVEESPSLGKDDSLYDRGISPVRSRSNKLSKALGVAVLLIILLYVLGVLISVEDDDKSIIDPVEEEFSTGIIDQSFLPTEPIDESKNDDIEAHASADTQTLKLPPKLNPYEIERENMIAKLAAEAAERERQARLERLKSPMIILDNSDSMNRDFRERDSAALSNESNENTFLNSRPKTSLSESVVGIANFENTIVQGSFISGVLETVINSDLPGNVRAIVSKDVYSSDGSKLLISRGARLVGAYQSQIGQGQERVLIAWDRLIMPDGFSIQIGSPGTDTLGRAGLGGRVNNHFWKRFGGSLLLTLIDGSITAGIAAVDDNSGSNIAVDTGNNLSEAAAIALNNSINLSPTIEIQQGTRIQIFVNKDLDFSKINEG